MFLQLDERNEKTNLKYFLREYLNTEIKAVYDNINFDVKYFDSANNRLIQMADVFANIYYSSFFSDTYISYFEEFKQKKIIKKIFEFPPSNNK